MRKVAHILKRGARIVEALMMIIVSLILLVLIAFTILCVSLSILSRKDEDE